MEQKKMIEKIVDFVKQHRESTASIAVYRRIMGDRLEHIDGKTLLSFQKKLEAADPEEIESCYYIIK